MNPTPDLSPQEALTTAKALDPAPEPKTRPRGRQGPGKGRPRAGRDGARPRPGPVVDPALVTAEFDAELAYEAAIAAWHAAPSEASREALALARGAFLLAAAAHRRARGGSRSPGHLAALAAYRDGR